MKKKSLRQAAARLVALNAAIELAKSGRVEAELIRSSMADTKASLVPTNSMRRDADLKKTAA